VQQSCNIVMPEHTPAEKGAVRNRTVLKHLVEGFALVLERGFTLLRHMFSPAAHIEEKESARNFAAIAVP
jgi:hypothetical protein